VGEVPSRTQTTGTRINITRRSVLELAAAWLAALAVGTPAANADVPSQSQSPRSQSRRYRVNATVMLASVPLFSKQNAGGALLALEETGSGECGVTHLQFAAGTSPERLKGFNRFGATREVVRRQNGIVVESSYESFMASCRETNLTEARQAFTETRDSMPLTVARGRSTCNGCSSAIEHRNAPARYTWANCLDLVEDLRGSLPLPPEKSPAEYAGQALPTFLFAVRSALESGAGSTTMPYMHNSQIYKLRTRVEPDKHANGLAMTGWVSKPGERGETEFKLWTASMDRTALPVRIEFRPRSFLRLTLEQDPNYGGADLRPPSQ